MVAPSPRISFPPVAELSAALFLPQRAGYASGEGLPGGRDPVPHPPSRPGGAQGTPQGLPSVLLLSPPTGLFTSLIWLLYPSVLKFPPVFSLEPFFFFFFAEASYIFVCFSCV